MAANFSPQTRESRETRKGVPDQLLPKSAVRAMIKDNKSNDRPHVMRLHTEWPESDLPDLSGLWHVKQTFCVWQEDYYWVIVAARTREVIVEIWKRFHEAGYNCCLEVPVSDE
jgi:hypothetical protein